MNSCQKHQKYNGLTAPKSNCLCCLQLFAAKGANRPARILDFKSGSAMKDKSKYSRKDKHKTAW